ncbi:unnamed protein product [Polarella glacialis]|uniref:Uncharacterized protein n=1 Tax=Polarella glacialis TaxID=89957 RepID=A0A813G4V0_POLGL|nr:unnamed protein product [Polarella glacialis]
MGELPVRRSGTRDSRPGVHPGSDYDSEGGGVYLKKYRGWGRVQPSGPSRGKVGEASGELAGTEGVPANGAVSSPRVGQKRKLPEELSNGVVSE